jgi:hypothetical protein
VPPTSTPLPPTATIAARVPTDSYAKEILIDKPVGYWRLDETEGRLALDYSGSGNHGTYSDGVKLSSANAANSRKAAVFDGKSSVTLPGGLPTGKSARTAELWFSGTQEDSQVLFSYGSLNGAQLWEIARAGRELVLHYWGNTVYVGAVCSLNCWHHVAVTYDGSTVQFYLDGVLIGSAAGLTLDTGKEFFKIGSSDTDRFLRPWTGSIAEVAVYDRVLSAQRIAAHYTAGLAAGVVPYPPTTDYPRAVLAAKPIAYWTLDETAATQGGAVKEVKDIASAVHSGVFSGTGYQAGAPGAIPAEAGTSVKLNGSTYVALCGRGNMPVGASPRTVELWFNATETRNHTLFVYGTTDGSQLWEITLREGYLYLHYWGNAVASSVPVAPGVWHHLAVTYDGKTTVQIYLNGKPSGGGTTPTLNTKSEIFGIGGPGYNTRSAPMIGSIDEVAVYDYVLPADIIAQHYAIGTRPPADSEWL